MVQTANIFDTLQYSKKLRNAGFTEEQAEIQAEALADIIESKLATKQDLKNLEKELRNEISSFSRDLRHQMKDLENHLTIKAGSIMAFSLTLLVTLMKIFHL